MLHMTPAMLEAAYELLRLTPPFRRWKLPEADTISFHVTAHDDRHGHFTEHRRWKNPRIGISVAHVKTLPDLAEVMAHEMIHLHLFRLKGAKWYAGHGAPFRRLAEQVCKAHDFDLSKF